MVVICPNLKEERVRAEKEFARKPYAIVEDKEHLKEIVRDALFISKLFLMLKDLNFFKLQKKNTTGLLIIHKLQKFSTVDVLFKQKFFKILSKHTKIIRVS